MSHVGGMVMKKVLLVTTLAAFLPPFMSSAVNVALPSMAKDLGADAVGMGWIATSFLLSAAVFLVPFGRLADMAGRKKVFTYGVALSTLASLLCSLSFSLPMLIGFRVLQGMGSAMVFATGTALLTSAYGAADRGRVLGVNVASTYLGLSLGPFLGGILTKQFGWSSIFLLHVPIGLLIIVLVLAGLKEEWTGAAGEKFDIVGTAIYGAALLALMVGVSSIPGESGVALIIAGAGALIFFIRWEGRTRAPVFEISLFRKNIVFAFSNLAALINYSATFAVTFLLSMYLQYIKGLDPQAAGTVIVAQPVVMAALSPFAGKLSDRIEPRIVASAGMAVTSLGLGLLAFLGESTPISFVIVSLAVLGSGFALFSSPNTNAVMSSVGHHQYGTASATLGTMRLTGQMMSIGVAMLLFALLMGRTNVTPEVYPSFLKTFRIAFILYSVLCLAGVFASLARGKLRR